MNASTPDVPLTLNVGNLTSTREYRRCSRLEPCTQWICTNVIRIEVDTNGPTISCPSNVTTGLECQSTHVPARYTTIGAFRNNGGSATDNCSIGALTISSSDNRTPSQLNFCTNAAGRTIIRTYTIRDACNNSSTSVSYTHLTLPTTPYV